MLFTKISTPLKITGAVAAAAVGSLALGVAPSAADPDKRAQFEKLDANGDESVSLGELYESAGYKPDGTVTEEFYAEMLAVAVSSANASTPGLFNEDGLKKLVASHLEPALEQGSRTVRNIFKEFDADGDGGLSFQEYLDSDSHNDWRDRDD